MATKRRTTSSPQELLAQRLQEACVVKKVKSHLTKRRSSKSSGQAPSQARARATFDEILVSSARVLTHEGYEAFNTNRIASEAGISVATLYQYFDDKSAIIAELALGQSTRLIATLERAVADHAQLPIVEVVNQIVSSIFAAYRDETRLFGLIRHHVPYHEHSDLTNPVMQRIVDILVLTLRARGSELALTDYNLTCFILVHAVDGVIAAALNPNISDSEYQRLSTATAEMVSSYLRAQISEV